MNFGQKESRDGYATIGKYYVQLPHGRLQIVSYRVDGDSGYLANVQYSNEARNGHSAPANRNTLAQELSPAYKPTQSYHPEHPRSAYKTASAPSNPVPKQTAYRPAPTYGSTSAYRATPSYRPVPVLVPIHYNVNQ